MLCDLVGRTNFAELGSLIKIFKKTFDTTIIATKIRLSATAKSLNQKFSKIQYLAIFPKNFFLKFQTKFEIYVKISNRRKNSYLRKNSSRIFNLEKELVGGTKRRAYKCTNFKFAKQFASLAQIT